MSAPLQRYAAAIQTDLGSEVATGDAKAQRLQTQQAIVEDHVRRKVVERQLLTVDDALAGELDVGVHGAPAFGTELFHRQHLVRRLLAGTAASLLFSVGVGTDQRRQVLEQQLVGDQLAGELGPRLAGDKGQVAMDVAVTDLAVEALVIEGCALRCMQVGSQVAVGFVGRCIRQRHSRQRVEVAQAGPGQAQAQVKGAEVTWVSEGAGKHHVGIGDAHVGLQREGLAGVLQCQQAADLAGAGYRLVFVTALGLEPECIILRAASLFRTRLAHDIAERDRLAQWVDLHLHGGFQGLVVEADIALVKPDGADVQLPFGRGLVLILRTQVEVPVGAAIGQARQAGCRFDQVDARDDDLLEHQRQQCQAKLHAFKPDHLRLFEPVRVAQGEVFSREVRPRHPSAPATLLRLGAPVHREVAIDCEGPVQRCGNLLVQQRLDAVPVEGGDHNHQYRQ